MKIEPTKVLFFGTPEIAIPSLQALIANKEQYSIKLVVTQPDKPAGRGGHISEPAVKKLAKQHDLPIYQPTSLKKELPDVIEQLSKYGPFDIGVVFAFGQILPIEILNLPRAGCVNVHTSLLPRWRGAAPIQRAILAGDSETGVCLMNMEAGLDTGGVYSRKVISIGPRDTLGTLHDRLASLGAEVLQSDLPDIIAGKLVASPQPSTGITYAQKISASETEINWNVPLGEIDLKIRAFCPIPGAYSTLQGKRIKILSAKPKFEKTANLKPLPGKIAFVDASRLEVECPGGSLELEEVQLEGKKRMPIKDFLQGIKLTTDMYLGQK